MESKKILESLEAWEKLIKWAEGDDNADDQVKERSENGDHGAVA